KPGRTLSLISAPAGGSIRICWPSIFSRSIAIWGPRGTFYYCATPSSARNKKKRALKREALLPRFASRSTPPPTTQPQSFTVPSYTACGARAIPRLLPVFDDVLLLAEIHFVLRPSPGRRAGPFWVDRASLALSITEAESSGRNLNRRGKFMREKWRTEKWRTE